MKKTEVVQRSSFDPGNLAKNLQDYLLMDLAVDNSEPLPTLKYGGGFPHNFSTTLAIKRQTSEFLKKFLDPSVVNKNQMISKALKGFAEINQHITEFELNLPHDVSLRPCDYSPRSRVLLKARNLIAQILGDLDIEAWFEKCRFSSGSTVGVKFVDTSIEAKSTWPMTVTQNCAPLLDEYLQYDVRLCRELLKTADPTARKRWAGQRMTKRKLRKLLVDIVRGSILTTVDKDVRKRRVIQPEPTGNMMLQLGLMELMYDALKLFGLDVDKLQDKHQMLAFLASVFPDLISTLDSTEASNCVKYQLVEFLFPRKWFLAIDCCRTPESFNPETGEWETMGMIGTMGNATTFPIETLVFYALAVCTYDEINSTEKSLLTDCENFDLVSVFGDDVILPTETAGSTIEILKSVGFIINQEKSFFDYDDHFRESCGADYYAGHNVRPFYLKAPVNNRVSSLGPWLSIIANRLFKKYDLYFGDDKQFYDSRVFDYILRLHKQYEIPFYFVPLDFPDDAGFKYASPYVEELLRRYGICVPRRAVDRHCTVDFNYHSFSYDSRSKSRPSIRLWNAFKEHYRGESTLDELEIKMNHGSKFLDLRFGESWPLYYTRKRKGGYVVGKGIGTQFYTPVVSSLHVDSLLLGCQIATKVLKSMNL